MHKFVLYCKSYRGDLDRAVNLVESIRKHNIDNIPAYVSVPSQDLDLFANAIGKNVKLISDEEIYQPKNNKGWIQQQIIKSNFWKLKECENYMCVDSDSYFIKDFKLEDFMYDSNTPYTLMHEQKDFFSWSATKIQELGFDPKESFESDRQKVMDIFERKGRYYDFGPGPVIWSSKVWMDLEDRYIVPNDLTFEKLIEYSPSEFSWYGESLLTFKGISIMPIEPMFKFFHYPQQLLDYKRANITESMIAKNYMGIVMQSNYNAPIKY